jgi:hypothetical protein
MRRDARDMDLPTAQMDEKEHVIGHQYTSRPDLSGEKVGGHQHLHRAFRGTLFPLHYTLKAFYTYPLLYRSYMQLRGQVSGYCMPKSFYGAAAHGL